MAEWYDGVLYPSLRDACPIHYRWIFGKVPNGLWPPPPPTLFWEKCCDFFQNHDDQHWICNEIFWIGNDPPPISKFFRKFMTKSAVSNAKKIATKFFGSEMTPPPPLWNFSKNSSIMVGTGFPYYCRSFLHQPCWKFDFWVALVQFWFCPKI